MSSQNTFQQRLEATHDFPTTFTTKIIADNEGSLLKNVEKAVADALGEENEARIRVKESSKGKYVSVSVEFTATDAGAVVALYQALQQVEGIRYVI